MLTLAFLLCVCLVVVEIGTDAVNDLKAGYPGARVEFMHCDLASFDSVRAFAAAFLDRQLPLHCLINNAGVMLPTHTKSPEVREFDLHTPRSAYGVIGAFNAAAFLQCPCGSLSIYIA